MASQVPKVLAPAIFFAMRRQFRNQLYARGIGRHDPEIIVGKGRADLDSLAAYLGDKPFVVSDRPTSVDTL